MRLSRLLAAAASSAAAIVLTLAVGAAPAKAAITDPHCNFDFITFNACLRILPTGVLNEFTPHVGLDALMSQQSAQEIINRGANPRAWLYGEDGDTDTLLLQLTLVPGWPAAGPTGLGAELHAPNVHTSVLNEDRGSNDQDELYAVVTYWDGVLHEHKTFTTGLLRGEFTPIVIIDDGGGGGGGGGCVRTC
jgi:hypothetical protein